MLTLSRIKLLGTIYSFRTTPLLPRPPLLSPTSAPPQYPSLMSSSPARPPLLPKLPTPPAPSFHVLHLSQHYHVRRQVHHPQRHNCSLHRSRLLLRDHLSTLHRHPPLRHDHLPRPVLDLPQHHYVVYPTTTVPFIAIKPPSQAPCPD